MKRIACFFTGGYTELNAMKRFMTKINNRVQYIQLCPNGPRKNKDNIRNRHVIETINEDQNGLTGDALINYIYEFIKSDRFVDEEYDAIIIEDDTDKRFLKVQDDGTSLIDVDAWEQHKISVRQHIWDVYQEIPIIFIYASPEIETWFLADWNNSFGKVYNTMSNGSKLLSTEQNNYFSVQFHKHIKENILTSRYEDCIEEYGYFNGSYYKLSEQIQNAFINAEFLSEPL
ncbi:MAG: hypothetical protein IJW77_00275, partial [Clostridia bacterium]|nr:hypothetical protein [Clostridia bacterium]